MPAISIDEALAAYCGGQLKALGFDKVLERVISGEKNGELAVSWRSFGFIDHADRQLVLAELRKWGYHSVEWNEDLLLVRLGA